MKFSIIMPTYNCEKYVGEAIESVLQQTFNDFELIIVDDGSQDGTFTICEDLAANKDRIRLFKAEHGGVSRARNFGLKKSQGDYVLFIDSDDSWEKDLLAKISEVLSPEDELLIFGYRSDYYLSDGTFQYSDKNLGDEGEIVELPEIYSVDSVFSSYNMAAPWNKVYKRDIIEKNELNFSEKCVYLEDLKFNFDYLRYVSNIKVLKSVLYHYRLFTDKKQILKRNFSGLFINADEVFMSCDRFLKGRNTSIENTSILSGLMIKTYANELLYHFDNKTKKQQKKILAYLFKNERFKALVRRARGKFFKIFNILSVMKLSSIQIKMLKNRYGR